MFQYEVIVTQQMQQPPKKKKKTTVQYNTTHITAINHFKVNHQYTTTYRHYDLQEKFNN